MAKADLLPTPLRRTLQALDRGVSSAVLLREAARTSRQWQTYTARTAFSGVLIAVLLLGIWAAVNATQTGMLDPANLGWLGRALFAAFAVAQLCLAVLLAPLSTASAIVEETDERTLDLLVLTRLVPGQILGAKVLSRILVLLTVVAGALPVMAMVVNLGGVSAIEVVAVTVHTLVTVVLMGSLGAFFALFTRSPMLAAMASTSYAVPFFLLLPAAYVICTGDPYDAAHFSALAAPSARDPSALLPALSYLPSLAMLFAIATPLFQLKVRNADFQRAFSDQVWRTRLWAKALGGWVLAAGLTLPVAVPLAWHLQHAARPVLPGPVAAAAHFAVVAWLWALFSALTALATWAFLRVGMDVVDGIDALFSGPGSRRDRRPAAIGANPVWWREARPRAWASSAAPIFVTWLLVLLAVFQSGWWIFPGGILAMGALNSAAALVLTGFLASRSIAEERRRGSLEVLLTTTLPTWKIVIGKVGAALMPTLPILALSMPLLVFGVPHLKAWSFTDTWPDDLARWGVRGLAAWVWLLPVWGLVTAASLIVALRSSRPRASFGVVAATLAAVLGIPGVVGRLFPDLPWVAVPARLVAPPLAGGETWWQLAFSTLVLGGLALGAFVLLVRNFRRWGGVALAFALALLLAPPRASAQPTPEEVAALENVNRLRMRAVPLADGLARRDTWTSLSVLIDNAGPATTGTLAWEEPGDAPSESLRFTRPVELPEGSRKQVDLLVRLGSSTRDRTLDLSTADGRVAVAVLRLQHLDDADIGLAVVGDDPLGLPGAVRQAWTGPVPSRQFRESADAPRKVRTGLVPPSTLPAWSAAWGPVDQVLWPRADPSGVPERRVRALLAWVADGGHLVLTVTDTWRQVQASPLAEALPVELVGLSDAEVEPLALALGWAPAGVAPVATAHLRDDRRAWVRAHTADQAPLWVASRWGLGTVTLVTADLTTAPLDQLDRAQVFRRLLTLPGPDQAAPDLPDPLGAALHLAPETPWTDHHGAHDPDTAFEARIRDRLSAIPGVAPVPMSWLVAFGTVYLLVIGPLDYVVLGRLGRQPWTWLTFPLSIAVFSAVALAVTSYTKGSQAVLTRVERVDLLSDAGLMRGDTWLGVFSTRKTRLGLRSGFDDSVFTPLDEAGFMTGAAATAGDGPGRLEWSAETWTLGYARSRWTAPLAGAVDARRETDGSIVVTSSLPLDLDEVAVLVGGGRDVAGWIRLGRLPAGSSVTIPADPAAAPIPPLEPADDLSWAVRTFHAPVREDRASLGIAGRPLTLVGVARRGLEPVSLTGLSPVDQPLLVVRAPLPDSLSVETDLAVGAIVVHLDDALQVWSVDLECDHRTREAQRPVGTVRFDGVQSDAACTVRVGTEQGWATVDVRMGDSLSCRPSLAGGLSCGREDR